MNCTYADNPKLACLWGLEATVLRVMQLRRRCALQGPGGTAASAASLGSTGASWPRYGSGSPSLAPAVRKGAGRAWAGMVAVSSEQGGGSTGAYECLLAAVWQRQPFPGTFSRHMSYVNMTRVAHVT